ncbi:MAG: HAD-IIA family hydrolase [Clostridia bacterium]|nr:HAD-IIA family hydrolase [Clostridia bacterium]MBQ4158112.1 HAD-IIA family hydrolase [Clostridia bacterium]
MKRLENVKCFLLDMDGTFYLGGKLIEGSVDFIRKVQETGRDFLFLTNNSSHNARFYVEKLKKMGLEVERKKILTSGEATANLVSVRYPDKKAFVLGNEFLMEEIREAGITIDQENPDMVIIGYDTTLDYKKMTDVCDFVRAGLPYVATHPDFNCPTETGFAPDIGAIIEFINASAFRRPELIVGKPNRGIVDAALNRTGLAEKDLAMVGDRLYTDIETGLQNGILSILVMSGETTEEMRKASSTHPDLVFGRLSDMNGYL